MESAQAHNSPVDPIPVSPRAIRTCQRRHRNPHSAVRACRRARPTTRRLIRKKKLPRFVIGKSRSTRRKEEKRDYPVHTRVRSGSRSFVLLSQYLNGRGGEPRCSATGYIQRSNITRSNACALWNEPEQWTIVAAHRDSS